MHILAGVLLTLVALEGAPGSSEDLSTKSRRALKSIVSKLTSLPALDALVHQQLPESVMKLVLEQVGVSGGAARAAPSHSDLLQFWGQCLLLVRQLATAATQSHGPPPITFTPCQSATGGC